MTTGATERTTTSGKEDPPEWRGEGMRATVVAGLQMLEAEDRGLDLTNGCYKGQGRAVRVIRDAVD